MIYVNYATLIFAVSLNIALYLLISRRYLRKTYKSQEEEKKKMLIRCIEDKEKLIKSYEHAIYLSDQEKAYLKDEIVRLEARFGINDNTETV